MSRTAKFTLTGGPIEATDRTLRALSRQVYYHYDPEFKEIFADTTRKLKEVFFQGLIIHH